jgi:hypothetical protein
MTTELRPNLTTYEVCDNEGVATINAPSAIAAAGEYLKGTPSPLDADLTHPADGDQWALEVRDTDGDVLLYVLATAEDGEWDIESWTPDQHGPVDAQWTPVWQRQSG